MEQINGFPAQRLIFRLDGDIASTGQVDAEQLGVSLAGWSRIIRLHSAAHFRGWASSSSNYEGLKFELRAATPNRGSYEITIFAVATGILSAASWDVIKSVWGKLPYVFDALLASKRESLEAKFIAERIRIAAEYNMPPTEDQEEEIKFAKELDKAAKGAATPINKSANTAELILPNNEIILINSSSKRWIDQPIPTAPIVENSGPIDRREIKLLAINRRNGWGRFEFVRPREHIESRQQDCKVINNMASAPNNIYTKSLNEQTTIRVWIQLITRPESEKGSWYYRIYGSEEPSDELLT